MDLWTQNYYNCGTFCQEHDYVCNLSNPRSENKYKCLYSKDGCVRVTCAGKKSGQDDNGRDVRMHTHLIVTVEFDTAFYDEDHEARQFVKKFFPPKVPPWSVSVLMGTHALEHQKHAVLEFCDVDMMTDFFSLTYENHACISGFLTAVYSDWENLDVVRLTLSAKRIQNVVLRRLYDLQRNPDFVQRQRWSVRRRGDTDTPPLACSEEH